MIKTHVQECKSQSLARQHVMTEVLRPSEQNCIRAKNHKAGSSHVPTSACPPFLSCVISFTPSFCSCKELKADIGIHYRYTI